MLKNTYVNKLINNLSIIDRIKFSCNEVIEKVILRYLDGYGNEKLQEFSINQIQNIVTIDFNKTLVQELTIEILGAQAIADIELNTYPIEKFSINEDIERKILLNTLSLTSSPAETTKPIERAFDGDLNSDAQLKKYSTYAWIHMSLDEERLIDKFNILSYRAATSGLIKKFRILVKNPMDQSWVEAGNYTVDEFKNEWLTIKTTPYLTKEVTLIVEDSENKWAYINEIELYNYSTLERDILNLFTDETLTDIRFNVSYKEIMNLKARVVNTQYFNDLLDKALEIYLSKEVPGTFRLTFDDLKVVDNITFRTYGEIEAYNVSYINSTNESVKISTPILENNENKTLNIPKILTKEIYVEIYGVSDPIDIRYKEYPLSDFALTEDAERKISKESIEILTINENSKFPLTNMLDGNERSESHMSGTYSGHHDYNFKFDTLKMVDKFKILSTRFNPNFTSGSIKRFELFNKDLSSNELVSLGTYFVEEYNDNWCELNFEPALTNELILRVYESDRNWICINEVEIYQHSLLEKAIKNLFLNNEFNSLKEDVTYWDILNLKKQVQNTKEYMDLLNIAEDLYYEDKSPVTLELKFDTLKVIDDIQFKVNGIMEKNYIGYINTQNENVKLVAPLIQNGENVTIDTSKFLTKKIYIELYGVTEINDLTFSEYPFEKYAIIEDIEKKLPKEMVEVFTKNENSNFPLINMFDGNEKSESHMSSTFNGHHDYNFKFNSLRIVDKFRILSTRFNPNFTSGSIKRFELLGKDLSGDKLILLGEYVVEEYNDNWRELDFTPILTDELILRIYESDRNWVCINEVEILHFSTLEARIEYLFTDKWCTSLRSDVTFEEIKELSDLVTITQEYRDLINRAFELFYDGVPPKSIEIEFDDLKVFSAIEFDIVGKLEKVLLSYYDTYHNLQEKDCSVQIIDDKGIITLEGYAYTKAVKIEAYAAKDIKNIKFTEHAIEEFVLIEDLEQRISYDEVIVSCNNVNESYPLSNMFDGNVKTDFRSRGFNEFLDINIKLKKASIIDEIGLTSFRFDSPNGVTGLIKKATILIKDTVSKNWLEFGKLQIDEFITNMHILKNIPYLTDEICIRILEAGRSWALINELSINKYSLLEAEIKSLFTDETYTLLKDSVTYKLIKALKERVVSSEDLKELVSKALELYFENKTPILEVIPVNNEVIFDRIDLEVIGEIERIVFEYKDAFKNRIQKTFDYIEQVEDKFSLNLPKLNGNNALIGVPSGKRGITTLRNFETLYKSLILLRL
ncbi:discoidin domain-containing protein [Candidatus Cetobacterium colombiensis]|uniref:F5/8 type C domain-containing protein n=1 Tax=Candidatus Cetobacterium colombiensis TaxID=3073100 RepID=A0ABU4WAZ9_9FUSO|nr:discoidin domain-containing protein [Candidatus Cetobacterium colombiensis]MDX8336202.1 hypothetical protein [Candidatus Cetobacterium colombiensis]